MISPSPTTENADPASDRGRVVRLATFNIRHGVGMDGVFDLDRTAAAIRALDADFVGLQEVDVGVPRSGGLDEPAELSAKTGLHASFARAIPYGGGEYGNALLSREIPNAVRSVPLPGNEPRVLMLAEFDEMVVGTAHLAVDSEAPRLESVEIIRSVAAESAKPFVFCGDWNATPDSSTLRAVQAGFRILSDPAAPTFHGTDHGRAPGICIDYIAVDRAHSASLRVRSREMIPDLETSDHKPLVVGFSIV